MAQFRLTNCGPKIVHDVLSLFRDKTLHDVLDPDIYVYALVKFPRPFTICFSY